MALVVLAGLYSAHAQVPSVLTEGTWYKVTATESGVYGLDAQKMRDMGIDVAGLNPKNLQIYGNGGTLLPQSNALGRPADLIQNAIWVKGEEDNRFDPADVLYFYAEGPHEVRYDSVQNSFFHQINPYSDSSYYYLTVGTQPGMRIAPVNSTAKEATMVSQFDDYWFHEKESVNLLQSGRDWWGEYLGVSGQVRLKAEVPGLVPNSTALLRGAGIASAQVPTRLRWLVNGQAVGEQTQGTVSTYRYDLKAQRSEKTYTFFVGSAPPASLEIGIEFDKNGQSNAQGYLNYVALQVKRQLRAFSNQQIYRFLPTSDSSVTYLIQDVPADWQWWNISDPLHPKSTPVQRSPDGTAKFTSLEGRTLGTYLGFSPAQAREPLAWQKVANQNLHGLPVPELLIVTPDAWRSEANRLAEFRRTHDGLSVAVVTTEQIYNEFSSGKADPTAIRDFARYLYQQKPNTLRYLLLFGDATYDYKNNTGTQSTAQQRQWVPVYESRESLHPVFTYSSDDYFGFLDDAEGEWLESPSGDHSLDIGVGRLPVKSRDEARTVVDKLIQYGSSPQTLGRWRNRISFVADDGDDNIHQQHADGLATQIQDQFLTQRLFIDAFPHIVSPGGVKTPDLNATIRQRINEGTLILNYTGHGGTTGWAEEQILTLADMQSVRGYNNLPLLLTATCEFGRYDDPALVSGAELMVLSARGAAIGALTTTRPVFSSTNFSLNKAFYEALATGNTTTRLGDLMKSTKNNSLSGSLNRNFALLGDPSMKLAQAEYDVKWAAEPDTLSALKKVTLQGAIYQKGTPNLADSFNGTASVTVYDKPVRFRTNGEGVAAAEYSELRNKLYDGRVTVTRGRFSASFVVPRNIDYRPGTGRVSVYAIQRDSLADAAGQLAVQVGGAEVPPIDQTPPQLTAYLNDSTFQDGQAVPANSVLWVKTFDESGVSISSAGLGQNLTAVLNDTATYLLNDYYQAQPDDYQRGTIRFPFQDLPAGSYVLRVKIWDNYTNSAEQTLRFVVAGASGIRLTSAALFPNPFRERLSFRIAHNRPDEDVEVTLRLFSTAGQLIHTFNRTYFTSEPLLAETIELNASSLFIDTKIALYLYDIQIRSIQDKSTARQAGKILRVP